MSDVVVLSARNLPFLPLFAEGRNDPRKSTWLSESDQELDSVAPPSYGTDTETSYEWPEVLHYTMIVRSNTTPFSVLLTRRSEVIQDDTTFLDVHPEIVRAYEERLGLLEKVGLAEGIELNVDSETDFWEFIDTPSISRKAELVFIGEGNIRAIWEDEDENFLGLHFLGNRKIIFVIFRQQPEGKDITTETGVESFRGIMRRISQHGLTHLVTT